MLVNIVTPLAFLPGAVARDSDFAGMIVVAYKGKQRTFSEQLIAQLPNKDVQDFITQSFDSPN